MRLLHYSHKAHLLLQEDILPIMRLTRPVWRNLPVWLRRKLLLNVVNRIAPSVDPRPADPIEPIVVAGLLSTASGTGESARLCLQSLLLSGCTTKGVDLSETFHQKDLEHVYRNDGVCHGPGTVIVHLNAPLLPLGLLALGAQLIRQKRVVGYWAWELPWAPESWRKAERFYHKVLVPSRFAAEAVKHVTSRPVAVLPHPVLPVEQPRISREECGLPKDCFLVGCVVDIRSSVERKNPLAAVGAFRKAFADDPSKHLALKVSHFDDSPSQKRFILKAIAGLQNVSLHDRILSRAQMQSWISNCDVVISLHRAEGFGLALAEAMQHGKPVVATNWSGNCDFMTPANSALVDFKLIPAQDKEGTYDFPSQRWAEPDIDHAAKWLRRLAHRPELRATLGDRAARDVQDSLSPSAYSQQLLRFIQD
jgi:glycosyltransferase involved in cell wall biosynthesis